jgi:hypothetical protein
MSPWDWCPVKTLLKLFDVACRIPVNVICIIMSLGTLWIFIFVGHSTKLISHKFRHLLFFLSKLLESYGRIWGDLKFFERLWVKFKMEKMEIDKIWTNSLVPMDATKLLVPCSWIRHVVMLSSRMLPIMHPQPKSTACNYAHVDNHALNYAIVKLLGQCLPRRGIKMCCHYG